MDYVARNSSEIIDGISSKTGNAIYVINMILNLISSSVMLIGILIALLSVDPVIALAAFGGFGLIYAFVIQLTRNRLLINSQIVARESTYVIKSLQEGLGGIRDVLIDGSQATYCQIYRNAGQPLRRALGRLWQHISPRRRMEAAPSPRMPFQYLRSDGAAPTKPSDIPKCYIARPQPLACKNLIFPK